MSVERGREITLHSDLSPEECCSRIEREAAPWRFGWDLGMLFGPRSERVVARRTGASIRLSVYRRGLTEIRRGLSTHGLSVTLINDPVHGGTCIVYRVYDSKTVRVLAWLGVMAFLALVPIKGAGTNLFHWHTLGDLVERILVICLFGGIMAVLTFVMPHLLYGGDPAILEEFLRDTLVARSYGQQSA